MFSNSKILILTIMIFLFSSILSSYRKAETKFCGLGPSFSYDNSLNSKIIGFDFSYTQYIEPLGGINLEFMLIPFIITGSLNPRLFLKDDKIENYALDLQLTFFFFFNIGGGVGYMSNMDDKINYHLFVGLPLGTGSLLGNDLGISPFTHIYIEPYYRYNIINQKSSNEFGILLKINTMDAGEK